jgi:hypothetical protein
MQAHQPGLRHDRGCATTPALPRVLPHRKMADPARRDQRGQRCRDPRSTPRERDPAPTEPETAPGLGGPRCARRPDQAPPPGVEGTGSSPRPRSCVGISGWSPATGPSRTGRDAHPSTQPSPPWLSRWPETIPAGATSASKANCSASATGSVRPRSAGSSNGWTLPLPKTPSALVRAGVGVSEMLARLLGAGPGRSW